MKYQTGTMIDRNIAQYAVPREKERLLAQLSLEVGKPYCVQFTAEPLTDHPDVLNAALDQYKREDGQYVLCGDFTPREKIQEILLDRFYMLLLTCTDMEVATQKITVLEVDK